MRVLTKEQYNKEAEPLLRQIFVIEEMPEGQVFAPNVVGRVLLSTDDGYLSDSILKAVVAAAEKIGEEGCYLSETGFYPGTNYFYIPLTEFSSLYIEGGSQNIETLFNMNLCLEHFIFSERGKWAIVLMEGNGLLGGSLEFIESVRKIYPGLDREVIDFLEYWRKEKKYRLESGEPVWIPIGYWLPKLLNHVYGEEKAAQLLQETGLP